MARNRHDPHLQRLTASALRAALCVGVLAALPAAAVAQEGGTQAVHEASERAAAPAAEPRAPGTHAYDMPALPTFGATATALRPRHEEERIGEYAQPRWTSFRRFPTTRAYVRPAGTFAVEWWLETKLDLSNLDFVRHRGELEMEWGLGARLQFDVYLETVQDQFATHGTAAPIRINEKFELRWAIAEWGKIPLNPTLYLEVIRLDNDLPGIEAKVLLADELAPGWFVASNLIFERVSTRPTGEDEYAVTLALAHSLADSHLSLGLEAKLELTDVSGHRFDFANWELLGGPSIWWSPYPPLRILAVALLGAETAHDFRAHNDRVAPIFEPTVIAGWEI